MKLELNKNYFGFTLKQEKQIEEIKSIARVFEHEKSGARLLKLENDDDNKVVFCDFPYSPRG